MSLICESGHHSSMLIDLCLEWLPTPQVDTDDNKGSGFSYSAFLGRINKGNMPARQKKIIVLIFFLSVCKLLGTLS